MSIRWMKTGERVPMSAPRKYDEARPRLRWRVGNGTYVEMHEDRVVDGIVQPPASRAPKGQPVPMQIRFLRPGERVPEDEPRRYVRRSGYVLLRWKIGVSNYVETYEHRVIDGFVVTVDHVHHRDRDKANNSPSNLVALSAAEHGREHRKIDRDAVVKLYLDGLSQPAVARAVGCNVGHVSRILHAEGVAVRRFTQRDPDAYRRAWETRRLAGR